MFHHDELRKERAARTEPMECSVRGEKRPFGGGSSIRSCFVGCFSVGFGSRGQSELLVRSTGQLSWLLVP